VCSAENKELQESMDTLTIPDEEAAPSQQQQQQDASSSSADDSSTAEAKEPSDGHHEQQSLQYTDGRENSGMSRSETFCSTGGDRK
jgi:hypothetical protein